MEYLQRYYPFLDMLEISLSVSFTCFALLPCHAMIDAAFPVRNKLERSFPLESVQMVHIRPVLLCLLKNVLFDLLEISHSCFTQMESASLM